MSAGIPEQIVAAFSKMVGGTGLDIWLRLPSVQVPSWADMQEVDERRGWVEVVASVVL